MILAWNEHNIEHIAKHGITRSEAEFVIEHARRPCPEELVGGKFLVRGQTAEGRFLQVIFVYLDDQEIDWESLSWADRIRMMEGEDVAYVIHARDLTELEKRRLRRSRR